MRLIPSGCMFHDVCRGLSMVLVCFGFQRPLPRSFLLTQFDSFTMIYKIHQNSLHQIGILNLCNSQKEKGISQVTRYYVAFSFSFFSLQSKRGKRGLQDVPIDRSYPDPPGALWRL